MTAQPMILFDPDALARLEEKFDRLSDAMERAQMAPQPAFAPAADYAARVGVTRRTVARWAETGLIETRRHGGKLMVKVE